MSRRWYHIVTSSIYAAYAVGFVLTFGYVAAEKDRLTHSAACATPALRSERVDAECYAAPGMEGFLLALVWPAYVPLRASWEYFE